MIVENGEFYKTYSLAYFDGDVQPHLQRDRSQDDVLTEIFKALK
jgi:hypothetical protein